MISSIFFLEYLIEVPCVELSDWLTFSFSFLHDMTDDDLLDDVWDPRPCMAKRPGWPGWPVLQFFSFSPRQVGRLPDDDDADDADDDGNTISAMAMLFCR